MLIGQSSLQQQKGNFFKRCLFGKLFDRISHTKPFGMTSLFDAIDLSLSQMKKARHTRKAIVIISDDENTSQAATPLRLRSRQAGV